MAERRVRFNMKKYLLFLLVQRLFSNVKRHRKGTYEEIWTVLKEWKLALQKIFILRPFL